MSTKPFACLLFCAAAAAVQAQEGSRALRPVVGLNYTFGGDKLFDGPFDTGESATVRAGAGIAFYGGAEYRFSDLLAMQATLGYHTDRINAANGGAQFSRVPMNLLAMYRVGGRLRLGAGIEVAAGPRYSASGVAGDGSVTFHTSSGPVAEAEYRLTPGVALKLRAAQHRFRAKELPATQADGDYVGLTMSYAF
jgi:hypothetical protein